MVKELREFLLRGNVIELAVAVAIGVAFTAIVTAIVEGFVNPLIAVLVGQPDMSAIGFTLRDAFFAIGSILQAIINFVLVGTVLFFLIRFATQMLERRKHEEAAGEVVIEPTEEIQLLREIRDALQPASAQHMAPPAPRSAPAPPAPPAPPPG